MSTINYIQDKDGNQVLPITSESAVRDSNGVNVGIKIINLQSDVDNLQAAYAALTQSDIVVVESADWPVSEPSQNTIYRVTGTTSYSDYMWDGSQFVKMAEYNNAIDATPTENSGNLVTSGGVHDAIQEVGDVVFGYTERDEITIDTSEHAYLRLVDDDPITKEATSASTVSYFEHSILKGEKVIISGLANANWAILALKTAPTSYALIEAGTGTAQNVEYTATEDCTIAFCFWNNSPYSMSVESQVSGLKDDVEELADDVEDIQADVLTNSERITNLEQQTIDVEVGTSEHAYIRYIEGSPLTKETTSSTSVSLFEQELKDGDHIKVSGTANTNWAILSIKNADNSYTLIEVGDSTNNQVAEYTATDDCVVVFNFWNNEAYSMQVTVYDVVKRLTEEVNELNAKVEDIESSIDSHIVISVKQNGGDYQSVTDAINYANSLNKAVDIYIYDGVYDVYEEQGGAAWLATISHSQGERQGLHLEDNVNLYGVGYVELRFELPDTATYDQSRSVSCLNLWNSNRIENINFIAKNCRYAIHDETDGGNHNITRYVKNCRLEHLGNNCGWLSITAMGGGASGGSQYDWINCQFITHGFFQAFSYHTHNYETPSHFNIDGCVGLCVDYTGSEQMRSFCAQYYGTGHVGRSVFNFKCCTGNGDVVKRAQTPTSEDHIDVYVNGYEKIILE